jgi:septum formation protein
VSAPRFELILASGSPRRRELMGKLGVTFEVITADVEEIMDPAKVSIRNMAGHNAGLKARAVAKRHPQRWVLGADTIVVLGERVLGKPPTLEAAQEYLTALSGREHDVITGCCLIGPKGNMRSLHDTSRVRFRELSPDVIAKYLTHVHVLDKAGAYALQEHGDWLVERIEGSRDNILGLPTEKLAREFEALGLV